MTWSRCHIRLARRAFAFAPSFATVLGASATLSPLGAQQQQAQPPKPAKAPEAIAVPVPAAKTLAFEGVTVIDVTTGKLLPEQTVVVDGTRLQAVGPSAQVTVPAGAQVMDARGKYMVPGFWDMHAHIDERAKAWYPLFLAHGITGVREMAQRFPNGLDSFAVWQKQVAEGQRIGPRSAGTSADLTNANGIEIKTADDANRVIDSLKARGVAFLKYHDDNGEPDLYYAMLNAAKRNGLPLVGHLSHFVPDEEASDSGHASVEHAQENHQCWPDFPGWPEPLGSPYAKKRCEPVAKAYMRNNTWMTPTLVVFYYQEDGQTQDAQRFVQTMYSLGFRNYLTGSDASQNGNILGVQLQPGFSLLQEIVLLARGGLTPLEALQAATLNPAKFLKATDSLGTVATGKLADVVLLDDNPLTNIHNVLKIHGVVANGRYFDRATLDQLDPEGVKLARTFVTQQSDEPVHTTIPAAPTDSSP